jgi:hypothetical protein
VKKQRNLASPYSEPFLRSERGKTFAGSLARKFHETKDLKVGDEIWRFSRELIKLDEPWVF